MWQTLSMLLITTSVFAGLSDYPADLSKWVASRPPKVGDDRWFVAANDTQPNGSCLLLQVEERAASVYVAMYRGSRAAP